MLWGRQRAATSTFVVVGRVLEPPKICYFKGDDALNCDFCFVFVDVAVVGGCVVGVVIVVVAVVFVMAEAVTAVVVAVTVVVAIVL